LIAILPALPPRGRSITWNTGPGWKHPAEVVPYLARLAVEDARHPTVAQWARRAVAGIPHGQYRARARALMVATRQSVAFQRDPPGRELVRHPAETLERRAGDCDCQTRLLGAAMHAIGERPRYIVVSTTDPAEPDHIWPEMWSPSGWITIDAASRRPRLGIGAGVAGRRRVWDAAGREVPAMQAAISSNHRRTAIVLSPGIGAVYTPGRLDGLGAFGFAPVAAAAAAVMPYIEKAIAKAKNWLFGQANIDSFGDFLRWAAKQAEVPASADHATTVADCLSKGIVPIYCSNSQDARDKLSTEFERLGWSGATSGRWWQRYEMGFGKKWHGLGFVMRTSNASADLVRRAQERAIADLPGALRKTIDLCLDGKGNYAAAKAGTVSYADLALTAVPVLPAGAATQAPGPGAVQVAPPGTAPTSAPMQVRPPTSAVATGGAPVQVRPPTRTAPAQAPAGFPPAVGAAPARSLPAGFTQAAPAVSLFAQMLAQQQAAALVRRAGAAARAYGLGAPAFVRLVDAATEAEINAGLPGKPALDAAKPLRTRAREVNYAIGHIGAPGMTRKRAAERLLAYYKAADAGETRSIVDETTRAFLATNGGFPAGAVPTLEQIAAAVGAAIPAAGAAPVQVAPPGTVPPSATGATATGLPAAPSPSAPGAGVPQQVAPPGTVAAAGTSKTTLAIVAIVAWLAMKKRRA
jgi:hypothetical protein